MECEVYQMTSDVMIRHDMVCKVSSHHCTSTQSTNFTNFVDYTNFVHWEEVRVAKPESTEESNWILKTIRFS